MGLFRYTPVREVAPRLFLGGYATERRQQYAPPQVAEKTIDGLNCDSLPKFLAGLWAGRMWGTEVRSAEKAGISLDKWEVVIIKEQVVK